MEELAGNVQLSGQSTRVLVYAVSTATSNLIEQSIRWRVTGRRSKRAFSGRHGDVSRRSVEPGVGGGSGGGTLDRRMFPAPPGTSYWAVRRASRAQVPARRGQWDGRDAGSGRPRRASEGGVAGRTAFRPP